MREGKGQRGEVEGRKEGKIPGWPAPYSRCALKKVMTVSLSSVVAGSDRRGEGGNASNAPQDDHDRTLGVADDAESLPHHQRRREHHGKVEGLGQDLFAGNEGEQVGRGG